MLVSNYLSYILHVYAFESGNKHKSFISPVGRHLCRQLDGLKSYLHCDLNNLHRHVFLLLSVFTIALWLCTVDCSGVNNRMYNENFNRSTHASK